MVKILYTALIWLILKVEFNLFIVRIKMWFIYEVFRFIVCLFSSDVWKYKNSDRKYILGSDRGFSFRNDSCSQKSTAVSQACILFNNLAGKKIVPNWVFDFVDWLNNEIHENRCSTNIYENATSVHF